MFSCELAASLPSISFNWVHSGNGADRLRTLAISLNLQPHGSSALQLVHYNYYCSNSGTFLGLRTLQESLSVKHSCALFIYPATRCRRGQLFVSYSPAWPYAFRHFSRFVYFCPCTACVHTRWSFSPDRGAAFDRVMCTRLFSGFLSGRTSG